MGGWRSRSVLLRQRRRSSEGARFGSAASRSKSMTPRSVVGELHGWSGIPASPADLGKSAFQSIREPPGTSGSMVAVARQRDPGGDYRVIEDGDFSSLPNSGSEPRLRLGRSTFSNRPKKHVDHSASCNIQELGTEVSRPSSSSGRRDAGPTCAGHGAKRRAWCTKLENR